MGDTHERVQSGAGAVTWNRSSTELARVVANHQGWQVEGDTVRDADGQMIARSIEDLACAMRDVGWFGPNGRAVFWINRTRNRRREHGARLLRSREVG